MHTRHRVCLQGPEGSCAQDLYETDMHLMPAMDEEVSVNVLVLEIATVLQWGPCICNGARDAAKVQQLAEIPDATHAGLHRHAGKLGTIW